MAWIKVLGWILGFVVLFSLAEFLLGIMPLKSRSDITPSDIGMEFSEIRINTSDGLELSGWEIPAEEETDRWIIVGHGYPFDKGDVLPIAEFLQEEHNILMIDFRSFGGSEGWVTTIGKRETRDIDAAVNHLREENGENISIGGMGFSMSASTLIMAQNPHIDAVVADSPYASLDRMVERVYRIFPGPLKKPFVWATSIYSRVFLGFWPSEASAVEAIQDTETPTLLIHGKADSQIPVENSEILYQAGPEEKLQKWFVGGAGHGQVHGKKPREYREKIKGFFNEHLE